MKPIRRHNLMHPHRQHFKHCCTNLCVRSHLLHNKVEPQKRRASKHNKLELYSRFTDYGYRCRRSVWPGRN